MQDMITSFLAEKLVAPQYYDIVVNPPSIHIRIINVPKDTWIQLLNPFFLKQIKRCPEGNITYFEYGETVRCAIFLVQP